MYDSICYGQGVQGLSRLVSDPGLAGASRLGNFGIVSRRITCWKSAGYP
jgi:hypothetical protein